VGNSNAFFFNLPVHATEKVLLLPRFKHETIINFKFKAVMKSKITVSENACIHRKNMAVFLEI